MDGKENGAVISLAAKMAGTAEDDAVLAAMCDAAAEELVSRLRAGVSREALGAVFDTAAGVLALSMYCAVGETERIRSYRAGNVSAELSGGEPDPEALRTAAERMLSGALADRGFDVMGVRG